MNPQTNAVRKSIPSFSERADVALTAQQCVNWCRSQGLEVTGVQRGAHRHRVYIKGSPLCDKLEGAVHRFERVVNVERRYWFAIRFNCEVRWNDEVKS
ncbi:MAG: hypothetical protein Q8K43_10485 [Sulfurimicrobium sp.]|nr:hypothetical protein [Gallionella sp.]MDP1898302.1 hypothetical protein [Sulfurimicrobium sp.]